MRKKARHLTVYLSVFSLLCMLTSCGKVQVRRMYEGSARPIGQIVRVSIPASLRVESLDGESTQEALIEVVGNPLELHLLPGHHELGLRYTRTWDNDAQGIERVRSDVVVVPLTGQAGEAYEIRLDEKVETYGQSKRFAADPKLQLVKTGQAKAASPSILSDTVKGIGTPKGTGQAAAPPPDTAPATSSNLERLRQAWEDASPEEQDAFIKSILKH